jgi:hypothetical protein
MKEFIKVSLELLYFICFALPIGIVIYLIVLIVLKIKEDGEGNS